ncbi:HAMP domain-containing histidine kinase [candidate division KSB1 bacterium]|nr:HAMP domain-containing histidine kinase [candidate division KSB1 bacterium]
MQKVMYRRVVSFKGLLFLLAVAIIGGVLFYTQKLVDDLREESRKTLTLVVDNYTTLLMSENPELAFEEIKKIDFPIVVTDEEGNPVFWKNLENLGIEGLDRSSETIVRVKKIVHRMDQSGNEPVPLPLSEDISQDLHYEDSSLIKQLRWLPYIEIVVVSLFILIGFVGFNSIRRSEKKSIWIGMAKETAHQLGTPISSILGWLEILREEAKGRKKLRQITTEMGKDVQRLGQVAARFSQIGSREELKKYDLREVLSEAVDYLKKRVPQTRKRIEISEHYGTLNGVYLNRALFTWVIENLMKNALDAITQKQGKISISAFMDKKRVIIDVADTGKGIEVKDRKNIFRPGYSTKTRGWGLGLSLAKRIVEDYHGGKLLLKESRVGEGTTMRIVLKR